MLTDLVHLFVAIVFTLPLWQAQHLYGTIRCPGFPLPFFLFFYISDSFDNLKIDMLFLRVLRTYDDSLFSMYSIMWCFHVTLLKEVENHPSDIKRSYISILNCSLSSQSFMFSCKKSGIVFCIMLVSWGMRLIWILCFTFFATVCCCWFFLILET